MNTSLLVNEIMALSLEERIALIKAICDSIITEQKHPNIIHEKQNIDVEVNQNLIDDQSLNFNLETPPKTGAELVTYWQKSGIINSRPDINNSQEYARKLRQKAENRQEI